jgi:hypothetical protein
MPIQSMVTIMCAAQIYLLAYLYQSGQINAGGFTFISMITLNVHGELDNFLKKSIIWYKSRNCINESIIFIY